jgi:hypothetical protein
VTLYQTELRSLPLQRRQDSKSRLIRKSQNRKTGRELKRMPFADAWTIPLGLDAPQPRDVRF